MKFFKYTFWIMLFFTFLSCEDVVHVDLETAEPKLVIEASIDWLKGSSGAVQKIKLSTTTGYYNQDIPSVSGAIITVTDQNGQVFNFTELDNSGEYFCYDFNPELLGTYTLNINVNDQHYTATDVFTPVPEILTVTQNNDIGFSEDTIEIKYFFQDDPEVENYYMDVVTIPNKAIPFYGTSKDEFYQGNLASGIFISSDIKANDVLNIKLYGVTKRYFNYMSRLLEVANASGGPFQTNVGVVRGNIVNVTNPDNYPLGYFRLSEISEIEYTVE